MKKTSVIIAVVVCMAFVFQSPADCNESVTDGIMAGYLIVPVDRVSEEYDAGFSMYVAAWPLLENYPGNRFQTGLFGTWMFAQYGDQKPENLYSDIEGGLGWWRDTRFATETPKFIMGGVAPNFIAWANGPGAGKGRDWDRPQGKYGVAQLSPWLLWPPDGVNLKQGTCGELFGYGYLALPLTEEKSETAGKQVPTGNNCWTLFINTKNFKGPVSFFTPYFWSKAYVDDPEIAGMLLDSRMADPNRHLQMETQYIPSVQAEDEHGNTYAKVAPTSFPRSPAGESIVVHRITAYDKTALWNSVERWLDHDVPADSKISMTGATVHAFPGRGSATWRIFTSQQEREDRVKLAWDSFAIPTAHDEHTFAYQWNSDHVTSTDSVDGPLVTLPEYYKLVTDSDNASEWVVIAEEEVPHETGLLDYTFTTPEGEPSEPYATPEETESSWKTPGPAAGPFTTRLGDGSVVTYSWYRFADQPALLNADLSVEERERLQKRVEKMHEHWTREREYLAPPLHGELAEIDPALIVEPPEGLEIGFVPIVTRQETGN